MKAMAKAGLVALAAAVAILTATTAEAGGGGVTFKHVLAKSTSCTTNWDCAEFAQIPNAVSSVCRGSTQGKKGKCYITWAVCPEIDGYENVWNPEIGECSPKLIMPNNGLVCYSNADCGMGGGGMQFDGVLVSFGVECVQVKDAAYGICTSVVADAMCAYMVGCFSNTDCYSAKMACNENGVCLLPSFSEIVGDGNVCNTDVDCEGSAWGQLCVPTGYGSPTGALCQECQQTDLDANGIHDGCPKERPTCVWGVAWDDNNRSYYECH